MRALVVIALLVAPAYADDASEELSAGGTLSGSHLPATSWIANRIAATWELDEHWDVHGSMGVTRAYPPAGEIEATDVFASSIDVTYAPDDHWSFELSAGWSPQSTTHAMDDDIAVAATSAMTSGSVSVSYDATDTLVSLGASVQRHASVQAFSQMTDGDLGVMSAALHQISVDASLSRTYSDTTDLGVAASYYVYDKDPETVGYWSLETIGRDDLGTGIGVAPLRYTVAPNLANRWGALSASLSLAYGAYAGGGYDLSSGLKIAYKLRVDETTRVKLYGKLAASVGVDEADVASTGSFALGAQFAW